MLPTFKDPAQMNLKPSVTKKGRLELLDRKLSGTFIQSIVQLPQSKKFSKQYDLPVSLVVGDMAGRGIQTFELREARMNRVKIAESASTHINMWVNCIVPLSES